MTEQAAAAKTNVTAAVVSQLGGLLQRKGDPDSGVNRVYEDTIRVETSSLCDIPDKRHTPGKPEVPGQAAETQLA